MTISEAELLASIEPKSDQINADDLLGSTMTVTIRDVRRGNDEQPVDVVLEGEKRFYRPCKTMLRLLKLCWGTDATRWIGRSMTLVHDPAVKFGGVVVGGIRISHLSHITKPLEVPLTVAKGRKQPHRVQVLTPAAGGLQAGDAGRPAAASPAPTPPPAPSMSVDDAVAVLEHAAAPPFASVALKMARDGKYSAWFKDDGTAAEGKRWMHQQGVHEALKAIEQTALMGSG